MEKPSFQAAGRDVFGREIVVTFVDKFDDLLRLDPPSTPFVILIAADTTSLTAADLSAVATSIVDRGAVYIQAWGGGCERMEEAVDQLLSKREPETAPVIMTTSHPDETLETVLGFTTLFAVPDEAFEDACRLVMIAVVGEREWYDHALRSLAHVLSLHSHSTKPVEWKG